MDLEPKPEHADSAGDTQGASVRDAASFHEAAAVQEAAATEERLARARRFAEQRSVEEAVSRRISAARVAIFVGAVAALLWAEVGRPGPAQAGLPLGLALGAVFLGLLAYHGRVRRRIRWFSELERVNQEAAARVRREWAALPQRGARVMAPEVHPYAADLDVVGHASLYQLLGAVGTAPGRAALLDWLLRPAAPAEIAERQDAVRELAALPEFRDELAARGRIEGEATADDVRSFLAWAEGEPALIGKRWLVWSLRLVPLATLSALSLYFATGTAGWLALGGLATHVFLGQRYRRQVATAFAGAFAREGVYRHDAQLFHKLSEPRFESTLLRRAQQELTVEGVTAAEQMRRLSVLMHLAEIRYSGMAHFPLQLLLMWDLQVLVRLERWQAANGRHVRRWLEALGEVDALCALGALAADHPHWSYPTIRADGPPVVRARAIAHPLLRPSVARANDVEIGPPGTFLLVTGSNMSGKSTLLRAIGTNVVLAQAGGPVCAAHLELPPVAVYTSMRLQDSLEEGVSFFMAELRRLKQIVDAAREVRQADDRTLLYLLDEILQGTNTAERRVAARRIVRHLLDQGAIGAVTTHDLALAEADALAAGARLVHFRETIERHDGRMRMSFDYRLRPGIATSTNALALMELVGLGLEDDPRGN